MGFPLNSQLRNEADTSLLHIPCASNDFSMPRNFLLRRIDEMDFLYDGSSDVAEPGAEEEENVRCEVKVGRE